MTCLPAVRMPARVARRTLASVALSGACVSPPTHPAAAEPPFQTPPVLSARDLLPPEMLAGPLFRVDERAPTDGLVGHFTARSAAGPPGEERATALTPVEGPAWARRNPGAGPIDQSAVTEGDGAYRLGDTRLSDPAAWRVAQTTGAPGTAAAGAAVAPEPQGASASELNKQLSNPVTSIWSLSFQFNNFRLENGQWNNNLQFQPVLPVGLTKDVNLITRPVIPLYNIVPHETAPGEFERTAGFGDIILLELLSPADSGKWILGAGPTFIFPTATSTFTGQGKWQAGPAVVVGYLTDKFIVGAFPQQWWSFAGDSNRPHTSQMNLQPFATWFFGEGWSVG